MSKDQILGVAILLGSIGVLVVYGYMLLFGLSWLAYGIVITAAVVAIMGIVAWIGWTMATTPPPAAIESLEDLQTPSGTSTGESSGEEKKD